MKGRGARACLCVERDAWVCVCKSKWGVSGENRLAISSLSQQWDDCIRPRFDFLFAGFMLSFLSHD